MTVQTRPTDAQLVALAERLGFEFDPCIWLPTPDGAFAIQAAMAGLGWDVHTSSFADGTCACVIRKVPGPAFEAEGATTPDAIVLAACAALGVPS